MALAQHSPRRHRSPYSSSSPMYTIPHFGRASDVIAEARASLKHPTRPFTPAPNKRDREKGLIWNEGNNIDEADYRRFIAGRRTVPIAHQSPHRPLASPLPRRLEPICSADRLHAATATESQDDADDEAGYYPSNKLSVDHASESIQYFPTPAMTPIPPMDSPSSSRPETASPPRSKIDEDQHWTCIIDKLRALTSQGSSNLLERFLEVCSAMSAAHWLRHGQDKTQERRQREYVMREIIKWMDTAGEPEVAIAGCKIVLNITRHDRVLANACKLLFKLSKTERNDAFFADYQVSDGLVDFISRYLSGLRPPKTLFGPRCALLTYAIATLRNISHGDQNGKAVVTAGGVRALGRAMKMITELDLRHRPDDQFMQAIHLLIQTTAALRNLISSQEHYICFLQIVSKGDSQTVVEILVRLLHPDVGLHDSPEIMLSVCRILSKLSLNPDFLPYLGGSQNIDAFLHLLVKYQADKHNLQPLLVRICFILGNLTTTLSTDHAHLRSGISDLVALLGMYISVEVGTDSEEEEEYGAYQGKETEEVLIKLIRLLANIAIDPVGGQRIVEMIEIEALVDLLGHKPVTDHEELVLNIVGALANFSFYQEVNNYVISRKVEIAKYMINLLLHNNPEAVVEALRILANLSHYSDVRSVMAKQRGTEILTILLDHANRSVLYQTCGVLINVVSPSTTPGGGSCIHRSIITQNDGVEKLVECMEDALAKDDYDLAAVAEKALHNIEMCSAWSQA
ncbi:uncharacterized protein SPPG_03380 [Spizellomyces punctatus DAOM BR117]|uniref:Armadillo repeat-containing domain-containing protein n=1 Tax=Spizellomyces punctatus (strain DAOM BR117) TaxID=645134 RepID=A0A0L0HKH3_SPIPD|nr:uncharacterized protein SPPG_03380 [Spizellomyces punctatus DAOM BR117]KND01582.1 hypothetical protein SPPG_03380 [Spizellomyces punctatus DAOM BR117]|eukprot:XP_016609621.1 hypothetical protein SPPG_03380 [Spizellomyces punctatus DAOM BR117]